MLWDRVLLLLHVDIHFFQHHLLCRLAFVYCVLLAPLSQVKLIRIWVNFYVVYSIPLSLSVLCSFMLFQLLYDVRYCDVSIFALFAQNCFLHIHLWTKYGENHPALFSFILYPDYIPFIHLTQNIGTISFLFPQLLLFPPYILFSIRLPIYHSSARNLSKLYCCTLKKKSRAFQWPCIIQCI
jgi:hypothetical protein